MIDQNKTTEQQIIEQCEIIKCEHCRQQKEQKALLQRVVNTLSWMVEDIKMRFDQTGIGGHYSPELTEAMNLLKELNVSVIRACKDTNELRTVVAKQMETQAEITQNGNT